MPTDNADINPYQSPAEPAGQEPSQPEQTAAGNGRFRWRVIPVTLLYIFSGIVMTSACTPALMYVDLLGHGIAYLPSGESIFWLPPVAGCMAMTAFAWFFAARFLWLGRWWRGIARFVLGLAACVGYGLLGNRLGLL